MLFVGHSVVYIVGVGPNGSARRRPKVTATLDPELLAAVDAHVAAHPELDRSAVLDEALRLWRARELELAMERQFAEADGVSNDERVAWDALRRGAAGRRLRATP
jgi:Arc/MetJ-type ribon-helix-helix transcriptional regulator